MPDDHEAVRVKAVSLNFNSFAFREAQHLRDCLA